MKNSLHAPEIEEKIIGTLLFFPDLLSKVDGLIPDMFAVKKLRFFYECIQSANKRDGSYSIDTITEEVTKKTNTLEAVPYLTELYGKGFTDAELNVHIKIVKEKYFLREVIKDSETNIELARKGKIDELSKKINIYSILPSGHDFLIGKTANQWIKEASERAIPKMLFSELWHETEFCIFFSTSGNGKSALAVQIGNAIASGIPISGFRMEATPQTVLYFDFELSDKQFEQRYSDNFNNHYQFDEKLIRIELNPDADKPDKITIEEFLITSIESRINQYNSKILLIDNLTYLSSDSEKAKEALPLMKKLKELKKKYDLSILGLTHTPKRDETKPIGKNDLFGSSMIFNFCDSCFTIGKSTSDESLRYIKQIKERFTAKIYDSENVITCQLEKPGNCLQLAFIGFGKESDYLKSISANEKQVIKEMVQQRNREGMSYREIAREFNITLWKVQQIIKPKK